MENSISRNFFEKLRGKSLSKSDIFMELEKMSKDIGESYYIFLLEELKLYLETEKIKRYDSFSNEQIFDEIIKRESEGEAINKFARTTNKKGLLFPRTLNLEAMFYPDEFVSLYKLQSILIEKISANDSSPKKIEPLDLVDFGDSKGTEKIIMLYLLGVLDYLKAVYPFNASTNLLATVISGITGENIKTIQSYINPIFAPHTNQKNNPLKNIEKVDIVRQKLIALGYKPVK